MVTAQHAQYRHERRGRERRDAALHARLLRQIVELAGDLGVPGVVIGPGKSNPLFPAPRERLEGFFFAALDELAPVARKVGTALWVENMPFAFIPDIEGLMQVLDRYGNDDIGIVYDVANGHFIKEDLGAALRRCRKRLKLVHLSDTNQQVYRHDPVGKGDVPFAQVPPVLQGDRLHAPSDARDHRAGRRKGHSCVDRRAGRHGICDPLT